MKKFLAFLLGLLAAVFLPPVLVYVDEYFRPYRKHRVRRMP